MFGTNASSFSLNKNFQMPSLTSSPLATLLGQTPETKPDFFNFNANIQNSQNQTNSTIINPVKSFTDTGSKIVNDSALTLGSTLSQSSDTLTKIQGQQMKNDAITDPTGERFKSTEGTDTKDVDTENKFSTSDVLNSGFSALGKIGEKVGGTAGQVMSGASNVGSSIINLTKTAKAAGGFKNLSGLAKGNAVAGVAGAASDMISSFMPQKTEYDGPKGDITQTMDSVYDSISDAAMSIPGPGMMIGGIMKAGALLGKGMNALGGGTDGMCVCAGTKVFKANGEIINVEDLKKEDGILGWDGKQVVPQLIHDFIEPRQKKCVEIVLKNGYSIKCSIDHPILIDNSKTWEFKRADKLKIGDLVGLANNIDYWGNINVPEAYNIGKEGIFKNIKNFDKVSICNLLAGIFDVNGDISVNKGNYSITLYSSLLKEIAIQFHKLGIFSIIKTDKHYLKIQDIPSIIKFYELIPLNVSDKKEQLKKIYNTLKDKETFNQSEATQCEIVSITPIGIQTVYNLQADYNHTYLANCIITHNTSTDAILGSSFFNLTPMGLINGFGGKKADTITKNTDAFETVGGSYSGANAKVDDALTKSGKKYGLFSSGARQEANREIAEAKRQQKVVSEIADQSRVNTTLQQSMSAINANRRKLALEGGYDQASIRAGKQGMSIEHTPTQIELISPVSKFKEGGSVNVLPVGALHARKHHMDVEGITEKGIPVIDNRGEQQAEIEHSEIIFRLEVTQKLEELEKKYSESNDDKYALEAGELLVEEILHNTDDKTGLISTLKQGGVINSKTTIVQSDIDKMVKQALINILTQ